jgi:hypothetical protein
MPLYKVAVEVEFYAWAEDEDDAHFNAEEYAREALADGGDVIVNVWGEVKDIEKVPKAWRTSLPYGEYADRTIAKILAGEPEAQPEPPKDVWTADMFPKTSGVA